MSSLTDDQKRGIEENKALAALRRAQKASKSSVISDSIKCATCASLDILSMYMEVFGEKVCKRCAAKCDDWQLINKTTVSNEYLLTEDCIQHMKHKTKENPHRKGWSEMKLYLRLHARSEGELRWGGLVQLQEEKERRERLKLERELNQAKEATRQTRREQDTLGIIDGVTSDVSSILADMLEGNGDNVLNISNLLHHHHSTGPDEITMDMYDKNKSVLDFDQNSSERKRKSNTYPSYQVESTEHSLSPNGRRKRKKAPGRLAGMLSAIRGNK